MHGAIDERPVVEAEGGELGGAGIGGEGDAIAEFRGLAEEGFPMQRGRDAGELRLAHGQHAVGIDLELEIAVGQIAVHEDADEFRLLNLGMGGDVKLVIADMVLGRKLDLQMGGDAAAAGRGIEAHLAGIAQRRVIEKLEHVPHRPLHLALDGDVLIALVQAGDVEMSRFGDDLAHRALAEVGGEFRRIEGRGALGAADRRQGSEVVEPEVLRLQAAAEGDDLGQVEIAAGEGDVEIRLHLLDHALIDVLDNPVPGPITPLLRLSSQRSGRLLTATFTARAFPVIRSRPILPT